MTKFRLVLLTSTTLTAMQFVSFATHAQSAPQVLAQTEQEKEREKKGPPPKPGTPAPPPISFAMTDRAELPASSLPRPSEVRVSPAVWAQRCSQMQTWLAT